MSPEDVKALRKELKCTAKDLARVLGVEADEVFAWESGEHFPTKRYVDKMATLRDQGPDAFPRARRAKGDATEMERLADPELWKLVRKLLAHPPLFRQAQKLAEEFKDPAEPDDG